MHIIIIIAIGLGLFWLVAYLLGQLIDTEAKNLSIYPGMMMWRTKKGKGLLDSISNKAKRFWKGFGSFSAILGSTIMFGAIGYLTYSVIRYILKALGPSGAPSVPSAAAEKIVPIPGLNIPLILGGISLATVLIIHEGCHGVILRNLKIKVKNVGLALFVLIPGAFVEQDDEDFEEADPISRIKVASAGPISNVLFGILCLGLIMVLISPQSGVIITGIGENMPADNAGLEPGDRVMSIDGEEMIYQQDFQNFMNQTEPGEVINIRTENGEFLNPELMKDPYGDNNGFLGVNSFGAIQKTEFVNPLNFFLAIPYTTLLSYQTPVIPLISESVYNAPVNWFVIELLLWFITLHALVAVFNLLPLKPLDGGHIIDGIAEKVTSGRKKDIIVSIAGSLTLFILLVNIFALF